MERIRAAKTIGVTVSAAGLAGVLGWYLDVQVLKSVLPSLVTMKFTTALSFFLAGVTLFFIGESLSGRGTIAQVVLPATTLVIMLIMTTLLASATFGLRTGLEELFVEEEDFAVKTTVPGRPSIVTMADFMALGAAGVGSLFRREWLGKLLFFCGVFISLTGAVALCGYVLGVEGLYFSWPGISTGMALATAVLFVLSGAALVMLSGEAR